MKSLKANPTDPIAMLTKINKLKIKPNPQESATREARGDLEADASDTDWNWVPVASLVGILVFWFRFICFRFFCLCPLRSCSLLVPIRLRFAFGLL